MGHLVPDRTGRIVNLHDFHFINYPSLNKTERWKKKGFAFLVKGKRPSEETEEKPTTSKENKGAFSQPVPVVRLETQVISRQEIPRHQAHPS